MTVAALAPPPADGRTRRPARWVRLRLALSGALVVAAFAGVLPRIASYDEAWSHLAAARGTDLALLGVLAAWNLASYWPLLIAALPGLTVRQAAVSNQVSTAVSNTVPAGGAWGAGITVALYRRWGFRPPAIARSLLVTGLWNSGAKLLLAAVAVVVLSIDGARVPAGLGVASLLVLAVLGAAVTALVHWPAALGVVVGRAERMASALSRRAGRGPVGGWVDAVDRLRHDAGDLMARRWLVLTAITLASHLSLFAVLAASLHAVGVEGVSLVEVFGAFCLVRVALLVPLTPGGAGLTEVGLAALVAAAGGERAAAVAGVLVFRAVTWALPVAVGGACWLLEVRHRRRHPVPPGEVAT